MRTYNAIITMDNGATRQAHRVTAADYTKAYLNIIRDFITLDIIIIDLREA